jgi:hypothetical protein
VNNLINIQLCQRHLLVGLFIFLFNFSFAQGNAAPYLERTMTINASQVTTGEILNQIEKSVSCVFSYNNHVVNMERKVSVQLTNRTVRQVLDKVFEGQLQYKERGNYIILSKATSNKVVAGYVENSKGEKIANASVYDLNTLSSATTNEYGYYEMKVKRDNPVALKVSKELYTDTVIPLQPVTPTLKTIVIEEENQKTKLPQIARTIGDTLRSKFNVLSNWTVEQFTRNPNVRNIHDSLYAPFQISAFPFVGTNGRLSGNIENGLSFNLFGGYNGGVRYVEFGSLFNIDRKDVRYFQMAGIFNMVGGEVQGCQVGGIMNINMQSMSGVQVGGIMNVIDKNVHGVSLGGVMNVVGGQAKGAQLGGVMNVIGGELKGIALAGVLNLQDDRFHGAQVSGFLNSARGKSSGLQIAGFLNEADTINGVQIAGFVNRAKHINGVQIGFINLSESMSGVPIGFFSYSKKGYHKLELAYDELNYAHLSFRSGSQGFYNILDVAARPKLPFSRNGIFLFGYGVGTAPKLSNRVALNFDVTGHQVFQNRFKSEVNVLAKTFLGVDYNFLNKCSIFAGVTWNAYITDNDIDLLHSLEYIPSGIREQQWGSSVTAHSWFGWKAGIRFF